MPSDTPLEVMGHASLPDPDCVMDEAASITEQDPITESSDPLDFFGAIREMVERGLGVKDKSTLRPFEKQERGVTSPKDEKDFKSERMRLEKKIATLELELKKSKERGVRDARAAVHAAESELRNVRNKCACVRDEAESAKRAHVDAESLILSTKDEMKRLEEKLDASTKKFEAEIDRARATEGQVRTELRSLRCQIGTPTATQSANPEFLIIFDGNTKAELAGKVLSSVSYKKDLEFAANKLTTMGQKLDSLTEAYNSARAEREEAALQRDEARNEKRILMDHLQQAAADVEVAQAQANAALRREREELLRVKNTLALERSEFRRYRGSSEATMKRLRQEATRAEQLQEQLTSKGLRLKQKEAEARALASDGSMVRGLRESLMSKDEALTALRQEFEDLRSTKAAAEKQTAGTLEDVSESPQVGSCEASHIEAAESRAEGAHCVDFTVAQDESCGSGEEVDVASGSLPSSTEFVKTGALTLTPSRVDVRRDLPLSPLSPSEVERVHEGALGAIAEEGDEGESGEDEHETNKDVEKEKASDHEEEEEEQEQEGDAGGNGDGDGDGEIDHDKGDDEDKDEDEGVSAASAPPPPPSPCPSPSSPSPLSAAAAVDAVAVDAVVVDAVGVAVDGGASTSASGGDQEMDKASPSEFRDICSGMDAHVAGTVSVGTERKEDAGNQEDVAADDDSDDDKDDIDGDDNICEGDDNDDHDEDHGNDDEGDGNDDIGGDEECKVEGDDIGADDNAFKHEVVHGVREANSDAGGDEYDEQYEDDRAEEEAGEGEDDEGEDDEGEDDDGEDDDGEDDVEGWDGGEDEVEVDCSSDTVAEQVLPDPDKKTDGSGQGQGKGYKASPTGAVELGPSSYSDWEDEEADGVSRDEKYEKEEMTGDSNESDQCDQCDENDEEIDEVIGDIVSAVSALNLVRESSALISDANETSGEPDAPDAPDSPQPMPHLTLDEDEYAETDDEATALPEDEFAAQEQELMQHAQHGDATTPEAPGTRHRELHNDGKATSRTRSKSVSSRVMSRFRVSISSCSLSPISRGPALSPRGKDRLSRSTYVRSPSLAGHASPMTRLAPAEHGLESRGNTVVIELGTWRVRAGVIDSGTGVNQSFFDDFPCCVARPRIEGADLDEMVSAASSMASPIYTKFRETGVFVGGDAWYCCMDHPDSGLRSKLRLSCPLERGRVKLRDGGPTSDDTERLVEHAFSLLKQDPSSTPTIVTYKPTAEPEEVWDVAAILMETLGVPAVRPVNEAQLAALAAGMTDGVVVDIGESGSYVTPIFDGLPVSQAERSEPCGGVDVTHFLDSMLLTRSNEDFRQMVDRRRLEYSRKVKEIHCQVLEDLEMGVKNSGTSRRKTMGVFQAMRMSPRMSKAAANGSRQNDDDDEAKANEDVEPVTVSFTQKAGTHLDITVGDERFRAPELLFQPKIWKESKSSEGLDGMVMGALSKVDADVRASMVCDVVLVGGSSAIPGLAARLEHDLRKALPYHLRRRLRVRMLGDDVLCHSNPRSRSSPSAVTKGAEVLLRTEKNDTKAWLQSTDWQEESDVLRRHWYLL